MGSLKTLSTINWVISGLYVLAGAVILFFLDKFSSQSKSASAADAVLLFGAIAGGFVLVSVLLHGWAAVSLPEGRGRILQTVLAVLHVGNFPLGTAYAVYAGWVCWMNEEAVNVLLHPREPNESDDQWADRLAGAQSDVRDEREARLDAQREARIAPRRRAPVAETYDEDDEPTNPTGRR